MLKEYYRRFLKRKSSVVAACILILFILVAMAGPFVVRYNPLDQDLLHVHEGISKNHLLGTDYLGRDTLSRVVHGARVSMLVSFSGVAIGAAIGIILGLLAGYYGGWIDTIISRLLEVMLAFPSILIAILIVAILGNGTFNTILAIAIYGVPSLARIIRSSVISIKSKEYVQVCEVFGAGSLRVLLKHILPNSMSVLIVNVTHQLGIAILTSSSLSFLGLGIQPPNPEWGAMLSSAREFLRLYPLEALAPGIAITLVCISFDTFGDGIRDALDPKLKNV